MRPTTLPGQAPVFADPSGRRRRRMRRAGIGLAAMLSTCMTVSFVGLLGGPKAPFIPWGAPAQAGAATGQANAPHGKARAENAGLEPGAGPAAASPAPSPAPGGAPGQSPVTGASPTGSVSGSPTATNQAGRTPPGRNRTKSPRPTPSGHTGAA